MAGLVSHVFVSAGWTTVLTTVDWRRKLGLLGGIAAGLLIATLDLEVVGRSRPAIRSLPRLPQWLDHIAFGAIVGVLLKRWPGIQMRYDTDAGIKSMASTLVKVTR